MSIKRLRIIKLLLTCEIELNKKRYFNLSTSCFKKIILKNFYNSRTFWTQYNLSYIIKICYAFFERKK